MTGSNLKTPREVKVLDLRMGRARSRTMGSVVDDPGRLPSVEESNHPRTTQDALMFLKSVRETFKDDESKYKQLLQILKNFQSKSICTSHLVSQVKKLFEAHPHLLTGMNDFLPPGYQMCDSGENSHSSPEGSHLCTGEQQEQGQEQEEEQEEDQHEQHEQQEQQAQQEQQDQHHERVNTGREEEEDGPRPHPAVSQSVYSRFPIDAAAATASSPVLEETIDLKTALGFVNKVKVRFQDKRHIFHGFLEVLNLYREKGLETKQLVQRVTRLFQGHTDLLGDFYHFLPPYARPPALPILFPPSKPSSSHTQGGKSSPSRHSRETLPQNRVPSKKVAGGVASKRAGSPTATDGSLGRLEAVENFTANQSPSGQLKRQFRHLENESEMRPRKGPKPTALLPASKKRRTVGDQEHNDSDREALPEDAVDQSSSGNSSEKLRGYALTEGRDSPSLLSEKQQAHGDCFSPRVNLEETAGRGTDEDEKRAAGLVPKPSRRQAECPKDRMEAVSPNVKQNPPLSPVFSPGKGKVQVSANEEATRSEAPEKSSSEQNHRQPKVNRQQEQEKLGGKVFGHEDADGVPKADGKLESEVEPPSQLPSRKSRRNSPSKVTKGKGDVSNGSSPRHLSERAKPAKRLEQNEGAAGTKGFSIKLKKKVHEESESSPANRNTKSDEPAREKLVYFRPKIGKRDQKEKSDRSLPEARGKKKSEDTKDLERTINGSRAEAAMEQSSSSPREEKRTRRSPNKKSQHLERSSSSKSPKVVQEGLDSPKRKRRRRRRAEVLGDDDNDTAQQVAGDESEKENQKQVPGEAGDPLQKVPQKRSSARLAHELLRRQCRISERVGQVGSAGVPSSTRLSEEDQKRMLLQQLEEENTKELQLKQREALEKMKLSIEQMCSFLPSLSLALKNFSEQVLSCPDLQPIVTQFQEDQEVEFSQCKRATVSYYLLPESYIKPLATARTALDEEVLNDEWISAGYDSEGKENSQDEIGGGRKQIGREGTGRRAPHDKRLYHEERLFLCEDDQFELDLLRHTAASTIKRLEEMVADISRPDFCMESFKLEANLTPLHVRCIERVYGDYGADLIELVKKKPAVTLPIILGRLKQKEEVDWPEYQKEMNKTWAEVRAEHFHKALHYSPSGKQERSQQCHEEFLSDSQCDGDADEDKCDSALAADGEWGQRHPGTELMYNLVKFLLKNICMSEEQFNTFHGLWSSHMMPASPVSEEGSANASVSKIDDG